MSVAEHHAQAATRVPCFVLTVSDTRTIARDTSGQAIVELLEDAGHVVVARTLVKDEPADVSAMVRAELARGAGAGDHHDRRHRPGLARLHV